MPKKTEAQQRYRGHFVTATADEDRCQRENAMKLPATRACAACGFYEGQREKCLKGSSHSLVEVTGMNTILCTKCGVNRAFARPNRRWDEDVLCKGCKEVTA